jgi:hypothetical protein
VAPFAIDMSKPHFSAVTSSRRKNQSGIEQRDQLRFLQVSVVVLDVQVSDVPSTIGTMGIPSGVVNPSRTGVCGVTAAAEWSDSIDRTLHCKVTCFRVLFGQ